MIASERGSRIPRAGWLTFSAVTALALGAPTSAWAFGGACSSTSYLGLMACRSDVKDDYYTDIGICSNESDGSDRTECFGDAWSDSRDAQGECKDVFDARQEVCDAIGQAPYDPDFDPADFTDVFANQNPLWPLAVHNKWVYEGGDETITVEVQDATKLIEGVTCIVVNDVASEEDVPVESTDDWYAQATNGDVWYCGEISQELETFDGDDPEVPELVAIDGSWKTGRDGAKPGVLQFAAPVVGTVYRQEWAFREAEDMAEVLSVDYGYGNDEDLDQFVPEELADLMCNDDCAVTREFTPLEPDANERKYYAPGIGLFLEVDLTTGEATELVECNLPDPRCSAL